MSNRTTKMVGAGLAPLAAAQIAGDLQGAVTAAGSNQGTATAVYGDNFVVTTCPAGAGVILSGPAFGLGDEVFGQNQGANACAVYPPVGGSINGAAANSPIYLQPGQAIALRSVGANAFYTLTSALAAFATGLTATGASQGTALQLTAQNNVVSTVAASTGVLLPTTAGPCMVANTGANALTIYPPTGGTINGLAANASVSLAVNKGALFFCNGLNSYSVAGI